MNKKILTISIITSIIVVMSIPSVIAQSEDDEIPSWVKIIAGAWFNDDIEDIEYINAMSFLIERGIIEIQNPIYMVQPEESELIINLNAQISTLNTQVNQYETIITTLEEENHSLSDKAVTDDVLADLETMRIRSNDHYQQLIQLQTKYDLIKAELDALKQN